MRDFDYAMHCYRKKFVFRISFIIPCLTIALVTISSLPVHAESLHDDDDDEANATNFGSISSSLFTQVRQTLGRSLTTSQVLTFNLTNAFILAILKGVVIGAGILGKISFWKFPGLGGMRSFMNDVDGSGNDDGLHDSQDNLLASQISNSIFSDEDYRWASTYMWAINKKDFGCLYLLACENKQRTKVYLAAGKVLNDAVIKLGRLISYNPLYEKILMGLEQASRTPRDQCEFRYTCRSPFGMEMFF